MTYFKEQFDKAANILEKAGVIKIDKEENEMRIKDEFSELLGSSIYHALMSKKVKLKDIENKEKFESIVYEIFILEILKKTGAIRDITISERIYLEVFVKNLVEAFYEENPIQAILNDKQIQERLKHLKKE